MIDGKIRYELIAPEKRYAVERAIHYINEAMIDIAITMSEIDELFPYNEFTLDVQVDGMFENIVRRRDEVSEWEL